MSDKQLWCIHVIGPDDVLACKDRTSAVINAMHLNLSMHPLHLEHRDDPYWPIAWAVPAVWPHSAESHAEDLAEREAEDPRWSGPNDLAPLAAEVFGGVSA